MNDEPRFLSRTFIREIRVMSPNKSDSIHSIMLRANHETVTLLVNDRDEGIAVMRGLVKLQETIHVEDEHDSLQIDGPGYEAIRARWNNTVNP